MALKGSFDTNGYEGRVWRFSWTATQNTANNTSEVSWKVEAVGGSAGWYMCGPFTINVDGYKWSKGDRWKQYKSELCSGVKTVKHNDNGVGTFSVSIDSAIYYYATGTGNGSKSFTLNTIARASQPSVNSYPNSVSSVNIGDSITIHMNKKANFTHKVTATFGNKSEVVTNSCVDNFVWTGFTIAKYAGQIPSATSGTLKFTVDTMSGSTKIGTKTVSVTANLPSSVVPSCSATVENTNNIFNCYAKLLSGVKVKPSASGSYGSSIKSIKISVTDLNDKTATSETTYTFDAFQKTGLKTIKVVATDSRNRLKEWSTSITVYDYSTPVASISASRGNGSTINNFVASDTGSYAKITAVGSVYNISGNILTPTLQYRVSGSSSWTNLSISTSSINLNTSQIIAADDTKSYDIRLTIKDKAERTATAIMTLSNGFATLDFKSGGDGIAFGKTATQSGFDCAMVMRILNGAILRGDGASGEYGYADWYYNNSGTQQRSGRIYGGSDGIHISPVTGQGFLDGTWSGSLSDKRMKRDVEPVAKEIINAVGEVPFVQFRMSADGYDHNELYVGILAQDLYDAFEKHGVSDKLLMLGTRKLNPDDDNEYYCIEYTHFLIVRLLYNELKLKDFDERLKRLENK